MDLKDELIYLDIDLNSKSEAFNFINKIILENNIGDSDLIKSMIKRDEKASVAIGSYLAIPHCEYEYGKKITINEFIFIKLKKPLIWDDNEVYFIIALILNSDKQIDLLYELAISFSDEEIVKEFYKNCKSKNDIKEFIKLDE